ACACFFFSSRRRHTRFSRDWSSDVCSSDLLLIDLAGLDPRGEDYAPRVVDAVLQHARAVQASDVHLVPTAEGLRMSWRLDGVLQPVTTFTQRGPNIVARLKVLAQLPTYRTDLPQEGRLQTGDQDVQMRVSTFPTLYGAKAVL